MSNRLDRLRNDRKSVRHGVEYGPVMRFNEQ